MMPRTRVRFDVPKVNEPKSASTGPRSCTKGNEKQTSTSIISNKLLHIFDMPERVEHKTLRQEIGHGLGTGGTGTGTSLQQD